MYSDWFKFCWNWTRPLAGDVGQPPETCCSVVPPAGDSSGANPAHKLPATAGQFELPQWKVSCFLSAYIIHTMQGVYNVTFRFYHTGCLQ
jgi:hypothetical protein